MKRPSYPLWWPNTSFSFFAFSVFPDVISRSNLNVTEKKRPAGTSYCLLGPAEVKQLFFCFCFLIWFYVPSTSCLPLCISFIASPLGLMFSCCMSFFSPENSFPKSYNVPKLCHTPLTEEFDSFMHCAVEICIYSTLLSVVLTQHIAFLLSFSAVMGWPSSSFLSTVQSHKVCWEPAGDDQLSHSRFSLWNRMSFFSP